MLLAFSAVPSSVTQLDVRIEIHYAPEGDAAHFRSVTRAIAEVRRHV
jgi:hypothetical protein